MPGVTENKKSKARKKIIKAEYLMMHSRCTVESHNPLYFLKPQPIITHKRLISAQKVLTQIEH